MENNLSPNDKMPSQGASVGELRPTGGLNPSEHGRARPFFGRGRIRRILGPTIADHIARAVEAAAIFARQIMAETVPAWAYRRWIRKYERISPQLFTMMTSEIARWPSRPVISVVMPVYNTELRWLRAAIESVRAQIYPDWELCISDDASTLPGVREELIKYAEMDNRITVYFREQNGHISANSNSALNLARGEFVAFLDADDVLPIDALYWIGREIALHPEVDLLFSDEDKIDSKGRRFDPYFKSAWNPALMLSQNAFSHLGAFRRSIVEEVGGFRLGYEGSQDHDLVLRCAAKTTSGRIRHIPRVLYHWRAIPGSTAVTAAAKQYAWPAGASAIEEHLDRIGRKGQVTPAIGSYYQVNYPLPQPSGTVSIVMPSACRLELLQPCMAALLERSTYANFEVLLAVNEIRFRQPQVAAYLLHLESDPRVRVLTYSDRAFNFSWINNWAARQAQGSLLCLMNDDIEIITTDWLERLVARATLEGVGAAGPMLYYPNNTIQHAGVMLGIGGVADHVFRRRRRGYAGCFGRAALEQDYSCLTAACLLVRRTVFDEIGGFDEAFPVAFNDVDFCIKIRRTGARIIWTPTVEMYHHESVSLGHHASADRRVQFHRDVAMIRERWNGLLEADPCYNPNFSLKHDSAFTLGWPPRTPKVMDILTSPAMTGISRSSKLETSWPIAMAK